jgi:hypothetical protein
MQDHPPTNVRPAFMPPWGWSRRQLIARSSLWFSVFPRTCKPELFELCKSLARSRPPYESAAQVRWSLGDLHFYGEQLLTELVAGSGIVYISGLCSADADVSDEVLRWAYLLLGMQLGVPVSAGTLLLDIGGANACKRTTALGQTQPETAFHTDSDPDAVVPDLVGTLCLQPALHGGEYQVSSALRARDVMWSRCRHLLEELYQPWLRAGGAGEPNRQRTTLRRPVFAERRGLVGLHFDYARPGIEAGHRGAEQPLRPVQQLALDYLDEALNEPSGCVHFQMKRGDMLFVNNHLVAHNRRPYVDGKGPSRRRMVRMWLSTPDLLATLRVS